LQAGPASIAKGIPCRAYPDGAIRHAWQRRRSDDVGDAMMGHSFGQECSSAQQESGSGADGREERSGSVSRIGWPAVRRRALIAFGALAVSGLGTLPAEARKKKRKRKKKKAQDFLLEASNLSGGKEVDPNPGDPGASGSATFTITANGTICGAFTFQTTTPNSQILMTHIHQGDAATNGPIVVDFHGQLNECVPIDKDLANQIKANPAGFYANVHTNNFTGGAARDQPVAKG
jgi:hypothetical protein